MDPPAIAFGNLLPYIENSEELHTAIAIWIRSHFLYRRLHIFRSKERNLQNSSKSSDDPDDLFTVKLRLPPGTTCFWGKNRKACKPTTKLCLTLLLTLNPARRQKGANGFKRGVQYHSASSWRAHETQLDMHAWISFIRETISECIIVYPKFLFDITDITTNPGNATLFMPVGAIGLGWENSCVLLDNMI
eukprot:761769-Hanusia_phi.AAC.2